MQKETFVKNEPRGYEMALPIYNLNFESSAIIRSPDVLQLIPIEFRINSLINVSFGSDLKLKRKIKEQSMNTSGSY